MCKRIITQTTLAVNSGKTNKRPFFGRERLKFKPYPPEQCDRQADLRNVRLFLLVPDLSQQPLECRGRRVFPWAFDRDQGASRHFLIQKAVKADDGQFVRDPDARVQTVSKQVIGRAVVPAEGGAGEAEAVQGVQCPLGVLIIHPKRLPVRLRYAVPNGLGDKSRVTAQDGDGRVFRQEVDEPAVAPPPEERHHLPDAVGVVAGDGGQAG